MEEVAKFVNEHKRQHEEMSAVTAVQDLLIGKFEVRAAHARYRSGADSAVGIVLAVIGFYCDVHTRWGL